MHYQHECRQIGARTEASVAARFRHQPLEMAVEPELARFESFYNAYRPHQALGQMTPMQAYHENFSQSALAA